MKTRLFTSSAFLVSIALLALSVPGRARFTEAQSRLASFVALPPATDHVRVAETLRSAPLMFIENVGQIDPATRFQVRGGTGTIWLSDNAIWITRLERAMFERSDLDHANAEYEEELRQGVNLKLSFLGANPAPPIEPFDRLDTVVSYFIGDDPNQWHPDVPVWGGVRYVDLYPGIDLELTSTAGQWQQRIIARPGADLGKVRLRVEGANTLAVDTAGHLRLTTAIGDFTMALFQLVTTGNSPVPTLGEKPKVTDNDIFFPFAMLTASTRSLSPVSPADNPDDLLYSTFLGGGDADWGQAIALDGSKAAYVTGMTESSDFPTTPGAFDTTINNKDAFVAKLNPAGSGLVYSTFLGGLSADFGRGIAVDGAGNASVTGMTDSSNFPTMPGAFDTTYNDRGDAFVVKLTASGNSLVFSTFLGGSENDDSQDIAVDGSGAAYVTGEVWSDDYPITAGAFDTSSAHSAQSRDGPPYSPGWSAAQRIAIIASIVRSSRRSRPLPRSPIAAPDLPSRSDHSGGGRGMTGVRRRSGRAPATGVTRSLAPAGRLGLPSASSRRLGRRDGSAGRSADRCRNEREGRAGEGVAPKTKGGGAVPVEERLGDRLVARGLATREAVERAAEEGIRSRQRIGEILIAKDRRFDLDEVAKGVSLDSILEEIERAYLQKALDCSTGNKNKAAELLGLSLRSIRYRLEKLNLE